MTEGISTPLSHDILKGRGNGVHNHEGNILFRKLVQGYKFDYVTTERKDKKAFCHKIYEEIISLDPPGRFLRLDPDDKLWYEIGKDAALSKIGQALREGAPDVLHAIQQPVVNVPDIKKIDTTKKTSVNQKKDEQKEAPKSLKSAGLSNGTMETFDISPNASGDFKVSSFLWDDEEKSQVRKLVSDRVSQISLESAMSVDEIMKELSCMSIDSSCNLSSMSITDMNAMSAEELAALVNLSSKKCNANGP